MKPGKSHVAHDTANSGTAAEFDATRIHDKKLTTSILPEAVAWSWVRYGFGFIVRRVYTNLKHSPPVTVRVKEFFRFLAIFAAHTFIPSLWGPFYLFDPAFVPADPSRLRGLHTFGRQVVHSKTRVTEMSEIEMTLTIPTDILPSVGSSTDACGVNLPEGLADIVAIH
jgi:hypothetical protein